MLCIGDHAHMSLAARLPIHSSNSEVRYLGTDKSCILDKFPFGLALWADTIVAPFTIVARAGGTDDLVTASAHVYRPGDAAAHLATKRLRHLSNYI
jgi:hypothetical protein